LGGSEGTLSLDGGQVLVKRSPRRGTLAGMAGRHQGQRQEFQAFGTTVAGAHALPGRAAGAGRFAGPVKVPAVKPYFWVVKLLTTAMGEAVSDYLVNDVNKYLAVVVGFILFVAAIAWQFRTPTYRTWPYWSAVAMVAVFGTMCADVMHIVL